MQYKTKQIVLALATGVGAWGGFPSPPQSFIDFFANNEIARYILVFILVWQGGGGQDPKLSLLITGAIFALAKAL